MLSIAFTLSSCCPCCCSAAKAEDAITPSSTDAINVFLWNMGDHFLATYGANEIESTAMPLKFVADAGV